MRIRIIIRKLIIVFLTLLSCKSYSVDFIKLQLQQLSQNKAAHNKEVIQRALEITEPEYGPFKLEVVKITMSGNRMLQSSLEGKLINTVIVPANK